MRNLLLTVSLFTIFSLPLAQAQTTDATGDIIANIRLSQKISEPEAIFEKMVRCSNLAEIAVESVGVTKFRTYGDVIERLETFGKEFSNDEIGYKTISFIYTAVERAFRHTIKKAGSDAEIEAFRMAFDYCQSLSDF